MHRFLRSACAIFFACLVAAAVPVQALDPTRPLVDFSLQTWNIDQGLPHDAIVSLAQTDDGYMWAGTWGGLARFNGSEFRHFDADNTKALKDDGILALHAGRNNTLWVGTHRGGLARLRDGRWQAIPMDEVGGFSHVLALLEDSRGTLYVGAEERGLFSVRGDQVARYGVEDGLPADTVSALLETQSGRLLIGTAAGLAERSDAGFRVLPIPDLGGAIQINALKEDHLGRVLVGSERGLHRLTLSAQGVSKSEHLLQDAVAQIAVDQAGAIWITAQERGILRLVGDDLDELGLSDGLPNSRLSALLKDSDSDIWIGTNSGLARLQDKAFSSVTARRGLSNDYVRAISEGSEGSILIGTSAGLNRLSAGQVETLPTGHDLSGNSILSLLSLPDGELWAGSYSQGVYRQRGAEIKKLDRSSGLPGNQVRALLQAQDGSVWIGTERGVSVYQDGQPRTLDPQALPGKLIMALHQTRDGAIWIGSTSGVGQIKNAKSRRFGEQDGIDAQNVFSFLTDDDGVLWLGTDSGLYRYKNGRFQQIERSAGLPENTIFSVLDDGLGYLWMSSNHGVFRIDKRLANEVADGRRDKLTAFVFGRSDGMASSQCNGGSQPAALRLRDGRLAFATSRGMALVDPARLRLESERVAPRLAIEDVLIDGAQVRSDGVLELDRASRRVEIRFAAISFREPERIRYRYRLSGLESAWSAPSTDRSAVFGNLPPGDYGFEVAASYLDGPFSENAQTLRLKVKKMWYETAGAAVLLALLLVLLGAGAYRFRVRLLRRRTALLQTLVGQRTQDLEIEKGRLEAAMGDKTALLAEIEQQSARFEQMAREDGLTGLLNRRFFDVLLQQEFASALATSTALTVAIADLDHFKRINDEFSHRVGDEVLRQFADIMRRHLRPQDHCARYGGEEFVLLFPGLKLSQARLICERICAAVHHHDWRPLHPDLKVSVSFGLSDRLILNHHEKLLSDADACLYEAKRAGRNRVCA